MAMGTEEIEAVSGEEDEEQPVADKEAASSEDTGDEQAKPKSRRRRGRRGGRSRRRDGDKTAASAEEGEFSEAAAEVAEASTEPHPLLSDMTASDSDAGEIVQPEPVETSEEEPSKPVTEPEPMAEPEPTVSEHALAASEPEREMETTAEVSAAPESEEEDASRPRRMGWWQRRTSK